MAETWSQKMSRYETEVGKIQIPVEPDKSDITRLESMIDQVYSRARFDLAKTKATYDRVVRLLKDTKTEAYLLTGKTDGTQKEREALAVQFARQRKVEGSEMTVEQALSLAEERYFFMESVIDILREKHGRLVVALGSAKLEKDLTR